jgi:predicted esterase
MTRGSGVAKNKPLSGGKRNLINIFRIMKKYHIKVSRTARYFTLGELNEKTKTVWFVCHGYGQLAEYFIRNFEVLDLETNFIIAPEALSRFYLEGFSGRVGAAWMTKEERDSEIEDYVQYLNELYFSILKEKHLEKINIHVLGFSQGVPAACRWVADGEIKFDKLILWAGIFPPDMNTDFQFTADHLLKDKQTYIVYGNQDPFLKEEHLEEIKTFEKIKPDLKVLIFEGKHELNGSVLKEISKE